MLACINMGARGFDTHTTITKLSARLLSSPNRVVHIVNRRNEPARMEDGSNGANAKREEGSERTNQTGLGEYYDLTGRIRSSACCENILTVFLYIVSICVYISGAAMAQGIALHHPHPGLYYWLFIPGIFFYIVGSIIHRCMEPYIGKLTQLFCMGLCTPGVVDLGAHAQVAGVSVKDLLAM